MGVVILKWNPGISSYTMIRFLGDLEKCALSNDGNADMNWSIWDYDKVHDGDVCYLLKVGYGQTGIAARGIITSEPYMGEDWSWRDRPTRYCDFNFKVMINPDAYPLLDSKALTEAIPDFDWFGGHSGVVLSADQAATLEQLWENYMLRQAEYFEKASDHNLFIDSALEWPKQMPYTMKLEEDYSGHRVHIRYTDGDTVHSLEISNFERILGKFGVRSWRALQKFFQQHYPTVSSLQALCGDLFRNQIEFEADFYKEANTSSDND